MVEGGDSLDLTFHHGELFELRLSFAIQQNRLGAQCFKSFHVLTFDLATKGRLFLWCLLMMMPIYLVIADIRVRRHELFVFYVFVFFPKPVVLAELPEMILDL